MSKDVTSPLYLRECYLRWINIREILVCTYIYLKFSLCIFSLLGMEYWFSFQLEFIFDIISLFTFMNPK